MEMRSSDKIEMVSHGFRIINLMNFILQSQEMFNKMGRYHITHNEILNMYLELLQDLDYFNIFLKKSIKILIKDIDLKRMQRKSLTNIPEGSLTNIPEGNLTTHAK